MVTGFTIQQHLRAMKVLFGKLHGRIRSLVYFLHRDPTMEMLSFTARPPKTLGREFMNTNFTTLQWTLSLGRLMSMGWFSPVHHLMGGCQSLNTRVIIGKNFFSFIFSWFWIYISLYRFCTHFQNDSLGTNAVSWAPYNAVGSQLSDGTLCRRLVTGSCDNSVRIWRFSEKEGWCEEENRGPGHTGATSSLIPTS